MRSAIRKLIILLLPGVSAGVAHSAEWKVEPVVGLRAGYNDNVRLNIDDKISSTEATLSPGAKFSVETLESGLSGNLRFDFRRFKEDSNLDENNVRFTVDSYRRMERSQLGMNASIVKDTTLDSQLEDTGLVFERLRRLQLSGGPNWSYSLNQRTQISADYNYSDVQYQNANDSGFVDFIIHSGQTSLARVLNERSTASLTLAYSQTDNDNNVESKNINLQGGGSYQFSETLSASLFAGVRRTETDFSQNTLIPIFSGDIIIGFIPLQQDISNSSSGYTFDSSVDKTFLRGNTGISASRNISNSANGVPIEVTRLSWKNQYKFSEILSASMRLELYNSKSENSATNSLNRDYYSITSAVTWSFQKFFKISGSYQYKKQTFDNTSDDATQNAAYLTLAYRWPKIAVSR